MAEKTVFREFSPDSSTDFSHAGFYTAAGDMFDRTAFGKLMSCGFSPGSCASFFTGVLMPYYLHNNNNLMVGVMGNIDLAAMFMPDLARVEPKLDAARTATCSAVDYLRQLSDAQGYLEGGSTGERVKRLLVLIEAACGRSVQLTGLDGMKTPEGHFEAWLAAVHGSFAWALLCMGGSGRVDYRSTDQGSVAWERPEGSGSPHMPGRDMAPGVLALSAGLLADAGGKMILEVWSEMRGEVRIVL